MSLILGLDFEATSLDTNEARIVEVGAVLWDTNMNVPVRLYSTLVDPDMPIPEETTALTGITTSMVLAHGVLEGVAVDYLNDMMGSAEYCMAHFGTQYDRPVWKATLARKQEADESPEVWIDSSIDIVYPEAITTRNLRHLAADHGFVAPFGHRAVFDVLTMFKVASNYDWNQIIARAKEPTLYVQAQVGFKDNQKAKDFQFRWHPESKAWWKGMKQSYFIEQRDKWDFKYNMLAGAPE